MATLRGFYPLPPLDYSGDWRTSAHERTMQKLQAQSDALPEGEIVGALVRWQVADGYAVYRVTSAQPLVLQHVPHGDGYTVDKALIRGLRKADILDKLAWERRWRRSG